MLRNFQKQENYKSVTLGEFKKQLQEKIVEEYINKEIALISNKYYKSFLSDIDQQILFKI